MNYFTLFPLSGYWGKFVGFGISSIALILLIINEGFGTEFLASAKLANTPITTFLWLFCIGLVFITFSKERIDDERVQKIRYTALRALALFHSFGLILIFAPFRANTQEVQTASDNDFSLMLLLMGFPLIGYQIIFNLGLYLNPAWAYNDLGAEENIRKNPKFFLIYTVLVSIVFVLFILLKNN